MGKHANDKHITLEIFKFLAVFLKYVLALLLANERLTLSSAKIIKTNPITVG